MNTFRKHATVVTHRFDSRLIRRPRGARAVPRIAAMLGLILMAGTTALASARHDGAAARKPDPAKPAGEKARVEEASDATEVPIKVYVAGSPERPYLVARIGDFPEDLGEMGKEFLKREFIENFIKDVMGLGALGGAASLKLALLPQADAREQECSFAVGDVSGRLTVRLAARQVFVLVSLDDGREAVPTVRA